MAVDLWTPERAGAASARSQLLTLLGEFVLPSGGWAWTSTLIDAMSTLGLEVAASRQALARSAAAGLIVSEHQGRRSRWWLTPGATRLLTEGAERIYQFGRSIPSWDGRWLLVVATVPETDRSTRSKLHVQMAWLGLAPLSPGVWVSPWTEREGSVRAALDGLDLVGGATSFVGRPGSLGDLAGRAGEIWDLTAVEARYKRFLEATARIDPADDRQAFASVVGLVHDWRHFPSADPGLPERLLPAGWPGQAAAAQFQACHDRWSGAALAWWRLAGRA